ncbi:hypothetical protein Vretimale_5231 [Volvox reticuliferus]|uniref:Uncharacterized protein n=1 Tax=Volvox reticuliferus TaxID=1737510 RepID=A0A8J4G5K6_9CHLO|nr:hypothetical protein Vretimale_5231 [Volvox reticuliferus]
MKAHIENGVEEINESNSSPKRALETSTSGEAGGTTREIRLANVRAKVKALSSGKSFRAFDAITDLIAEVRLSWSSCWRSLRVRDEPPRTVTCASWAATCICLPGTAASGGTCTSGTTACSACGWWRWRLGRC